MPLFKHLLETFRKLVSVLVISLLVTETSKNDIILEKVPCIYYLVWFTKNEV